jgi:hypothetical protein
MTQEIGQEFLGICFANRWRLAIAETSSTSPSVKLAQDDTLTENVAQTRSFRQFAKQIDGV